MLFVVDVESDGPIPGPDQYSMVCFGVVAFTEKLDKTFYGQTKPISNKWNPESLAISGFTREQHLTFPEPAETFKAFADWIAATNTNGRPVFIADNPAYDFAWINYYFHAFTGSNPFGFSGRRIGDLYAGLTKDFYASWKHLRKTFHSHMPTEDAIGNAEALLAMHNMGLKLNIG